MIARKELSGALGRLNAYFDQLAEDDDSADHTEAAVKLAQDLDIDHAEFSGCAQGRALKAIQAAGFLQADGEIVALIAAVWMEGAIVGLLINEERKDGDS